MQLIETAGKRKGFIRRNFTDAEFQELVKLVPHVLDQTRKSIRERVYCLLNNITKIPNCKICSLPVAFNGAYTVHCSSNCTNKDKDRDIKTKNTRLKNWGNATFNNPNKSKQTCLQRYGVEHTSKLATNRLLAKVTKFERYGNENYTNQNKAKQTCLEKYGVDNPSKSKVIKDKIPINKALSHQKRRINGKQSGYVYCLEFSAGIKIGVSANIENRFKTLVKDFGTFKELAIIKSVDCYMEERKLHQQFADNRICLSKGIGRTEFFNKTILNELIKIINKNKT